MKRVKTAKELKLIEAVRDVDGVRGLLSGGGVDKLEVEKYQCVEQFRSNNKEICPKNRVSLILQLTLITVKKM